MYTTSLFKILFPYRQLQRASLRAQLVNNLPAKQETPVQFLGWEDPLEKATHSVFSRFPCGLAGKESTRNAGDPGSIPESGRSAGEGTGYPLQYPWASLGKECACITGDLGSIPGLGKPLEKGKATHSSILAWRIPWTKEPGRLQSKEHREAWAL